MLNNNRFNAIRKSFRALFRNFYTLFVGELAFYTLFRNFFEHYFEINLYII